MQLELGSQMLGDKHPEEEPGGAAGGALDVRSTEPGRQGKDVTMAGEEARSRMGNAAGRCKEAGVRLALPLAVWGHLLTSIVASLTAPRSGFRPAPGYLLGFKGPKAWSPGLF